MRGPIDEFFQKLTSVPGVLSVKLGGSRARGEERPDSDWDVGLYYRGSTRVVDAADIRAFGHPGQVVQIGEWGPVMNGGAWLLVGGQRVDVLYRDLDAIDRRMAESERGVFDLLHLPGYLAGAPSYMLLGELALGRVLHGEELPRPEFPAALRLGASRRWGMEAQFSLDYAAIHAGRGARAECHAMLTRAALATGHSRLARRGEWVLNEKRLLERAGLEGVADILARGGALADTCAEVRTLCALGEPEWKDLVHRGKGIEVGA